MPMMAASLGFMTALERAPDRDEPNDIRALKYLDCSDAEAENMDSSPVDPRRHTAFHDEFHRLPVQ